jgi:hypothetical protein
VGPRVPFAEPPNGTPEPRREEEVEWDIKGGLYISIENIFTK